MSERHDEIWEATRFAGTTFAPVAVSVRNDVEESIHLGAAVVTHADGEVEWSVGDTDVAIFPRSALKPFQADAMVGLGLDLEPRLLAVVAASHSGEAQHLAAVREILELHGFTEDDLQNTATLPWDADAKQSAIAAGVEPSSLQQNCSGKHAGMLATCRVNGWSTDSYLDPDHPLQAAITERIDGLASRDVGSVVDVGVDGCGAPTHVMPLVDVARAMSSLVASGSAVTRAMTRHPDMIGGSGRDVTEWMTSVEGLAAKEGAAGVLVAATVDGRATALKIADGSDDARRAVMPSLLKRLGVDVDIAHRAVRDRVVVRVLGHGVSVGSVNPLI